MIGNTFFFNWEVNLMVALQSIANPLMVAISKVFSVLGQQEVLVAIIAVYYLGINKKIGMRIGLTAIIGTVFNTMIKNIFLRRRPYFDHEQIKCLAAVDPEYDIYDIKGQGFSFPSAHSTNSTIIPGVIYTNTKKRIALILTIIIGLGVGISRALVGCHYPTDILFGWLQAIIMLITFPILFEKIEKKYLYPAFIIFSSIGLFYCTSNDYFSAYGIVYGLILCDIFDEKVTKFKNTKSVVRMIARIAFSGFVFLLLNTVLKMPFTTEFLESGTLLAGIVRSIRYAISSFAGFGICPLIYKYNILKFKD